MDRTDESLMLAVRDGDTAKLAVLFDRYHARLFDFFCRMDGSRATSEDLVQEVFFRILKYRSTFNETYRFRTWMYQIARNARLRHTNQHLYIEHGDDDRVTLPADNIERDEEARLLQCALDRLSEETRELLVLVWYQELPYIEIAELLGIEVGAVKVRVHRALKKLRELFQEVSNENNLCDAKTLKATFPIF